MKIEIEGKLSDDPRSAILAIEGVTRSLCQQTGKDPAEGVMMLLTAAVHMSNTYSASPIDETVTAMATALGYAVVAADDMFKLRAATQEPRQ
ncbi:hypothetical protein M2267_003081 [Ensifer sp. KUDG1]|uniref:hypothetical protein n=1 Tax=Ensifer sp. KUDG1 TaxID=3373919 RepID=UPI003D1A8084